MTMKTPAMMNQYGDTYTGMPNGRATTKPLLPALTDRAGPAAPPGHLPHHRCYVHPATARVRRGLADGYWQPVRSFA